MDKPDKPPSGPPPSPKNEAPRQAPPSALLRWVPGLTLFRDYRREWLRADLLAGVSVWRGHDPVGNRLCRPDGAAATQHGSTPALVPLLVYPFFGSSRQVIVGPTLRISLLIASAIVPLAAGDPARAAALAATVAVLSGLLLLLGARARIGAIADFLSKPVLVGYMTGAALILVASQLDKLFAHPAET